MIVQAQTSPSSLPSPPLLPPLSSSLPSSSLPSSPLSPPPFLPPSLSPPPFLPPSLSPPPFLPPSLSPPPFLPPPSPLQTSVCQNIMEQLGQANLDSHQKQVVMVSQDSFYKNLTEEQSECADAGEYNFDHPGMVCVEPLDQQLD